MNGEPALYGTMGQGEPQYAFGLFSRPYVTAREESVIDYPLGEQTALDIPINRALLNLGDHGVLADVHRLRQADQRDRDLRHWNRRLEKQEEFTMAERREYFEEKRKVSQMRRDVRERLQKAKVATRLNQSIEPVEEEREVIRWPQPGSIIPPIEAAAGPNNRQRPSCGYCGFTGHESTECDTPHYLCSYRHAGRCLVPRIHRAYRHELPQTCIYGGRHQARYSSQDDIAELQDQGSSMYDDATNE